jgi:hypothetical protein
MGERLKLVEAEHMLSKLLETQRRVLGNSNPDTVQTLMVLGAIQTQRGGTALAPDLRKAIKSPRPDDPLALRAMHSLVDALRSEGRLEEAKSLGRELLHKRLRGPPAANAAH